MKSLFVFLAMALPAFGQSPDVPVIHEGHGAPPEMFAAANSLREAGQLLSSEEVKKQLTRTDCHLELPAPRRQPLTGSEIWNHARKAHIRIGYLYLCPSCDKWHLNIAGGYAITADGAVATCEHVLEPKDMKEAHLVAATDSDRIVPVVEVLASSSFSDVAIVRIRAGVPLCPLPLNVDVRPGDDAWCYSDPVGSPGYFSKGIVNRFFRHWHDGESARMFPVRMNVSTDWAPGSSGSAVLDCFGNAIGHVSQIAAEVQEPQNKSTSTTRKSSETLIVFHKAVPAADVKALIKFSRSVVNDP